jgi:hypothetical protein
MQLIISSGKVEGPFTPAIFAAILGAIFSF